MAVTYAWIEEEPARTGRVSVTGGNKVASQLFEGPGKIEG